MKLVRILFFPFLAIVTATAYWFLSHEPGGTILLLVFGGAMTFFMWVLVPTFDHEGNTAPIDPDFTLPED
jgi:hypothetical protein